MARGVSYRICLKICKEYKQGQSSYSIARKYSISGTTVLNILRCFGVPTRSLVDAMRKHIIKDSYFSVIDTEHKACALGYIAAEGHIEPQTVRQSASLTVIVSRQEKEHLQKIVNLFSNYEVKVYQTKTGYASRVRIRSNQIVSDLHHHGIHFVEEPNRFPVIDPNLHNHHIRAYFDGDGSLYRDKQGNWSINFAGNYPLLSAIQEIIMGACKVEKTKILKCHNTKATYILKYRGNRQVPLIVSWLYRGATIYYNRKFEKAKEMFRDLQNRKLGSFKQVPLVRGL